MTEQDDPADADRTVFRPATTSLPPAPPASQPPADRTALPASFVPMAPRTGDAHIQVGDVLNHIFEVRRFIARGGMGEVFEGVNVNSDERVAIKVMLPALAADPAIQAMFRKEARTLTRLSHPALVAYRVLAQEPQLGVYYIVTEYIDGANLSDVLGTIRASPAELLALTRRLADGLRAAHALGAIHRDMSPDNVLLEDGRLAQARIIDFGIAKDLDPGAKTIVGDGFAGKLGYVAPEQLGDFDREVGPWSDVYGLGLVILAVALGRDVDMGKSFVEAIDRRRKGVDLSGAPAELRPVLARMLAPNPAERLRSMDEVIAAVDAAGARPAPPPAPAPPPEPGPSGSNRALLIGGAAGAALLLAGGAWFAFGGHGGAPAPAPVAPTTAAASGKPAEVARAAVAKALPTPRLHVARRHQRHADRGRARGPRSRVRRGIRRTRRQASRRPSPTRASRSARRTSPRSRRSAPPNATQSTRWRAIRADGVPHMAVPQRKFEMSRLPADSTYAGQIGARAVINLDLGKGVPDFAMYGIEPNGAISALIASAKDFATIPKTGYPIADLGGGRYRLQVDANHTGWSGIILLTGQGGFSDKLVVAGPGERDASWRQRFSAAAAAGKWKSEMVWFKMVNELPD